MILTPIRDSELLESLVSFTDSLSDDSFRSVFRRVVARGDPARAGDETCIKNLSDSIDLITFFGIGMKPGSPLSWTRAARLMRRPWNNTSALKVRAARTSLRPPNCSSVSCALVAIERKRRPSSSAILQRKLSEGP